MRGPDWQCLYSADARPTLFELYPSAPQPRSANVLRVDTVHYSTAELSDVDDRYYYGVSCQSCMRAARISLSRLRASLGDVYPLVQVVRRLKCRTCGSKQITVTFLAPHQAVGNLAYLFKEQAR